MIFYGQEGNLYLPKNRQLFIDIFGKAFLSVESFIIEFLEYNEFVCSFCAEIFSILEIDSLGLI